MASSPVEHAATFSPLEARVIRLAASRRESDRGGRRLIDRLAGRRDGMRLADPRLEALRLQAVRLRDGGTVDPAFIAVGYTDIQAREIAGFMSARRRRASPAARRSAAAHASGIGLALGAIVGFVGLTVTCLI